MRPALLCFAAASLLLSIALGTSAVAEEKIVAVVDQQPLTEADMRLAEIEWGDAVANLSPADRRKTLLAFLIETQLLARAAVADNVLSKDEAASIERFNGRLGLRNAYFQRRVKERVTEADARKVYDTQVKEIPLEEEIKARHILVDSEPRAAELKKQLAEGLSFAAAAQKFSQDPTTNVAGGDLGYSLKGQLLDEIDRTAFALKKGEVSEPVKSRFGWHLVLVEDRRTRQMPAFDQLKNAIMAALMERKAQTVLAELRKKAKIDIRDPALVAALAPAETGTGALPTMQAPAPAPISEGPVRKPDGEFNTYSNGDLYGGDLRTLKNVEQKACRSACEASGECKGYSFDRWNGWCFLKSTVGSLIFDPSSISGVKTTLPEPIASDATVRIDRRPAKGYSGRHTRSSAVASFEQCEEACRSNKACVGYTYSKSAKTCKAFHQIENFGPEANAVSGYKTQTPQ